MRIYRFLLLVAITSACFCKDKAEVTKQSSESRFYSGVDTGIDSLRNKASDDNHNISKKNTKRKVLFDAFSGYNFYFGKFFIGIDGDVDFKSQSYQTKLNNQDYSLKRRFSFAITPKFGYNIFNNFNLCFKFGTLISSYKVHTSNKLSKPTKSSLLISIEIEKSIGDFFVRGGVNKIFKRKVKELNETALSAGSYSFKIGGGYRF